MLTQERIIEIATECGVEVSEGSGISVGGITKTQSELVKMIEEYFINITPEQLKEDLIKSGMKVKEKCEYCEVDVDDRKSVLEIYNNDCYYQHFYIDENNNLTDGDIIGDRINYCPMCGREL